MVQNVMKQKAMLFLSSLLLSTSFFSHRLFSKNNLSDSFPQNLKKQSIIENNDNQKITSLKPLTEYGVSINDSDIIPVEVGINPTLLLDCYQSAIVNENIVDYSIYIPYYSNGNTKLTFEYITQDDEYHFKSFYLEDEFYHRLIDSKTQSDPERQNIYYQALNLHFYHMDRHPYSSYTDGPKRAPTFVVDLYHEEDSAQLEGLTNEFTDENDFRDYEIRYFDEGNIPISFDDNPVVNFIPKQYFRKPCEKKFFGKEYGFYIKTTEVSSVKNKSEFFVYAMKKYRGKQKINSIEQDNPNYMFGRFGFELRPLIQGRIFYYQENDTVTGIVPTNEYCIENPHYSFSIQNNNGKYNDPKTMLSEDEDNTSAYIQKFMFQLVGQTKTCQTYSPVLKYAKDISSIISNFPFKDPATKEIVEISDAVIKALDFVYNIYQNGVDKQYKDPLLSRDKETNKIISNTITREYSDTFDASAARRGFSLSLQDNCDNYNAESAPILYKNSSDYFMAEFQINPLNSTYCYAQDVFCTVSFNLKKDNSALLVDKPLETIIDNTEAIKGWHMFYDPYNEINDTIQITEGTTVNTDVPNKTGNKKSFAFKANETGTHAFTFFDTDSRMSYQLKNGVTNVSSSHGYSKDKEYIVFYSLTAGATYTLTFLSKSQSAAHCSFRIDKRNDSINPIATDSTSPAKSESKGISSQLYSFIPKSINNIRQKYLLQTSKTDDIETPDTYLELLDSHFRTIAFSDNTLDSLGSYFRTASLMFPLKAGKQYYVSVQIKKMLHSKEKVGFRIIPCKEVGNYDRNNNINYPIQLNSNTPAIAFHILIKTAGTYHFRLSGLSNPKEANAVLQFRPAEDVKTKISSLSNDDIILSHDLIEKTTFYFIIYLNDSNQNTISQLTFNYWRDIT